MPTEYDALYRAVLVAPDDDVRRLVLADWLEGNGQESRAAEIRAGVVNALPSVVALPGFEPARVLAVVRRGFVESITISLRLCMYAHADLFSTFPVVGVTFSHLVPMENGEAFDPETGAVPWIWILDVDGTYENRVEEAASLPALLFNALEDADQFDPQIDTAKSYPSPAAAELALSRAAVTVGRKAAGLPPIH